MLSRWLSLVLMVVMAVASTLVVPAVAAENKDAAYRATIEARAAKAEKDKDVQALVECAYALYPVEMAAKVKEPRYLGLVDQAVEIVLAKKDAEAAKQLIDLAGPLSAHLPRAKKDQLNTLALGKAGAEAAKEDLEVARGVIKKAGPDLLNPEIKTRGGDQELGEKLGLAAVRAAHPTGSKPKVKSTSVTTGKKSTKVYAQVNYYGALTGWKYTAEVTFTFYEDGTVIIDYSDDNAVPVRQQGLDDLKEGLEGAVRK